jgi:hypothetical protein
MHKFTKLMLVVGIVLTLISFIVMVIGYGFAFDQILEEDDEEEIDLNLEWNGPSPNSWDASNLDSGKFVYIFASTGDQIEVSLSGADENNYFINCESQDSCFSGVSKATGRAISYIGELEYSGERDVRTLEFSGDGEIEIYTSDYDDLPGSDGFLLAGLGVWGCCCGVFFLIIGGVSAFMIKDNKTNFVVLQNGSNLGQPFFSTPSTVQQIANVPTQAMNNPDALSYYQSLLHQGYDQNTANETTKIYYPDWKHGE